MAHMTVSALDNIREWYRGSVLEKLELQRAAEGEKLDEYKLVHPAAHIGWVPPNGFPDDQQGVTLPCIVVGLDKKISSAEETLLQLRITAAVYDPGHQQRTDGELSLQTNMDGCRTLLNFMDALEAQTLRSVVIADNFELCSPIEAAMYEEQPYPYWYGYLKFTVKYQPYPQTRYAGVL